MTILACLTCGSRELRIPAAADGALVGTAMRMDQWVCDHGHLGVPLRFDDEASWRAFANTLRPRPAH